jgi:hypothetical protein
MKSRTTPRFWAAYRELPDDIKERAREAYARFRDNPSHPSLQFKKVHDVEPVYSARITRSYRALGLLAGDEVTWFWIGSHDDYDRLLTRL